MTLSSILVQVSPENLEELLTIIKKSKDYEYHLHDESGKIIITLEGETTDDEIAKLSKLQNMDLVLSAEMVYSYNESELEQMRDNLEISSIPEWLNKDNVRAEDIVYHGDLKKKKRHNF